MNTHIKTWRERMPEPWLENACDMNCSPRPRNLQDCPDCVPVRRHGDAVAARDAEIADLRAALLAPAAPAARVKTWRERIGADETFPLHAPTDVERAMVAEIAELRALVAAPATGGKDTVP